MSPEAKAKAARVSFIVGIVMMGLAALAFGLSNNLAKISYDAGVTVWTVIAGRAWLGFFALLVVSIARGHKLTLPRVVFWLFVATATANMIQNPAILLSMKLIPISLAILIIYLFPIMVALFSALLGHETITRPVAISAVVGFVGVALILELGTIVLDWRGMVLAFVAACGLATNVMGAARMNLHMPALVVPLWLYGISLPFYTAMLMAQGGPHFPSDGGYLLIFLGAIGALPVALVAFYSALLRAGAARASLVMNFEPLFTILLAALLLHETLGPMQIAGGLLIIGSIFYVSIYGRH